MQPCTRTFDHTANVGLRARAVDLNTLFAEAARAMFSVMVENIDAVQSLEQVAVRLEPDDLEAQLRNWLSELLYIFHVRKLLLSDFTVRLDESEKRDRVPLFALEATARGERLDPARHKADIEIKAVTWHGLKVERTADGWLAEVIVDI